jgi:hypothetical protein
MPHRPEGGRAAEQAFGSVGVGYAHPGSAQVNRAQACEGSGAGGKLWHIWHTADVRI